MFLADPEFYRACPTYLFLRDLAISMYAKHVEAIHKRNQPGWDPHYDDPKVFLPVLGSFVKHTHQLAELDLAHLKPLRAYLVKYLGYDPDTIVLYYRFQGEEHEIMF